MNDEFLPEMPLPPYYKNKGLLETMLRKIGSCFSDFLCKNAFANPIA